MHHISSGLGLRLGVKNRLCYPKMNLCTRYMVNTNFPLEADRTSNIKALVLYRLRPQVISSNHYSFQLQDNHTTKAINLFIDDHIRQSLESTVSSFSQLQTPYYNP